MEKRIYNFAAGPAILPEEVLLEAQKDLFSLPGVGMSVMEISHRSKTYDAIHQEAKAGLKKLLDIPDDYSILFLQGGASLQFSMVPMNIMPPKNKADYISTGSWSKKAIKEAKRVGTVNVAASTEEGEGEKKLFEITEGEAHIVRHTGYGYVPLANLQPGDFLGNIPFVDLGQEPFNASVFGSENLKLESRGPDGFQKEYHELTPTFKNFIEHVATCISVTSRVVCEFHKKNVQGKNRK